MASRQIPDGTNEKILALMALGKNAAQTARLTDTSSSYCSKLNRVVKLIANSRWEELIEYSKIATTGGCISWACKYLDVKMPQDVKKAIDEILYKPEMANPVEGTPEVEKGSAVEDNTAVAMVRVLEELNAMVESIKQATTEICDTVATARKLNDDNRNTNFDILGTIIRDGMESIKTTIRKSQK